MAPSSVEVTLAAKSGIVITYEALIRLPLLNVPATRIVVAPVSGNVTVTVSPARDAEVVGRGGADQDAAGRAARPGCRSRCRGRSPGPSPAVSSAVTRELWPSTWAADSRSSTTSATSSRARSRSATDGLIPMPGACGLEDQVRPVPAAHGVGDRVLQRGRGHRDRGDDGQADRERQCGRRRTPGVAGDVACRHPPPAAAPTVVGQPRHRPGERRAGDDQSGERRHRGDHRPPALVADDRARTRAPPRPTPISDPPGGRRRVPDAAAGRHDVAQGLHRRHPGRRPRRSDGGDHRHQQPDGQCGDDGPGLDGGRGGRDLDADQLRAATGCPRRARRRAAARCHRTPARSSPASTRTPASTCRRVAPTARSSATSRRRWATSTLKVFQMTKEPTSTETPANTSSTVVKMPIASRTACRAVGGHLLARQRLDAVGEHRRRSRSRSCPRADAVRGHDVDLVDDTLLAQHLLGGGQVEPGEGGAQQAVGLAEADDRRPA